MRRSHRFYALVLELLVLYVAALSGGVACTACAAEHARVEAHGHHQTPHAPTSHQHQHAGAQCLMADGCTVASTSAELTPVVATLAGGTDRVLVADEHLLRRARPAPEPPPPRA